MAVLRRRSGAGVAWDVGRADRKGRLSAVMGPGKVVACVRERIPTLFVACVVILMVRDWMVGKSMLELSSSSLSLSFDATTRGDQPIRLGTTKEETDSALPDWSDRRIEEKKKIILGANNNNNNNADNNNNANNDANNVADTGRKRSKTQRRRNKHNNKKNEEANNNAVVVRDTGYERDGFMVLGMHRSGTSMLTGLLYMAAGYKFGGHLYSGQENPKGFFERFDAVGQNSNWMSEQGIQWQTNVQDFSWESAIEHNRTGTVEWKGGARAARLLFNNPSSAPWLQKDPRMCITLNVWRNLNVLKKEPAIVFTYRHPLEVAKSIHKRGPRIKIFKGLHLWIVYNMRAIQNARGLCIVKTSNVRVLADAKRELTKISEGLTQRCNLPPPPHPVKDDEIKKFIDRDLQHHDAESLWVKDAEGYPIVLETHNDGACPVYEYLPEDTPKTPEFQRERKYYLLAMKTYCDLESGRAHADDYEWPDPSEPPSV